MDRLGELLSQTPISEVRASSAKGTCTLPKNINKKESHYAQKWHEYNQIPYEIYDKKTNDIPTIYDGLKAIDKFKKQEEKQK